MSLIETEPLAQSSLPGTGARLVVFGATGRTGRIVVRRALESGCRVVAYCRHEPAPSFAEEVEVVVGGLLDSERLETAIDGADAVICTFGPAPSARTPFCALATRAIIAAMWSRGVHRLVCVTGALVGERNAGRRSLFMRMMKSLYRRSRPELARDLEEQEEAIAASGLDWTIVKPPRLVDAPPRGGYRSGSDLRVTAFSRLSREDLAACLLDLALSEKEMRKMIVVVGKE